MSKRSEDIYTSPAHSEDLTQRFREQKGSPYPSDD